MSSMRVESRSVSSGLNPHVSAENRSSVPAVTFGSIHGTVGRAAVVASLLFHPLLLCRASGGKTLPVETH